MSTKKPKRTSKSTSKKSATAKAKTKTRATRSKKKPEEGLSKVGQPSVDVEITESKLQAAKAEPVEIKMPVSEREAEPPSEIQPETVATEVAQPVTEAKAEPEPEKAEATTTLVEPIVVETKPQQEISETKKPLVESKPEPKMPQVKVETKKRPSAKPKPLPKPLPKEKLPEPPKDSVLLIIRLRGTFAIPNYIERTLQSLRLRHKFNATLARNNATTVGMLRHVKDYVTWGDLTPTELASLLRERGEVNGGNPVTDKFAMDMFSKDSIESLAKALTSGDMSLQYLWEKGVKPVFRLRPPSGGFESTIKKSFTSNGQLGYRGCAIAKLMTKMS